MQTGYHWNQFLNLMCTEMINVTVTLACCWLILSHTSCFRLVHWCEHCHLCYYQVNSVGSSVPFSVLLMKEVSPGLHGRTDFKCVCEIEILTDWSKQGICNDQFYQTFSIQKSFLWLTSHIHPVPLPSPIVSLILPTPTEQMQALDQLNSLTINSPLTPPSLPSISPPTTRFLLIAFHIIDI